MNPLENCGFYTDYNTFPAHSHTCCELFYLTKGKIQLTLKEKSYLLEPGSMYILSPMERHYVTCLSQGYERFVCFLDLQAYEELCPVPSLLSILKNRPPEFNHVFTNLPPYVNALFIELTKEFHHNYKDPYSSYRSLNLYNELLIQLYRCSPDHFKLPTPPSNLQNIQHYLELHYMEPLKIKELADTFYINQYYLTHAFKKYTGYSPKQYITKLQFMKVRKLLLTSNHTISEIAEATGFETVNDLSRRFKKEYGITPREYRKLNQNVSSDYCPC
ncbi:MAG: AraC family transcriptional regulator [bacterium]|nr:AraC family transcriptional regulator [bacterium]